MEKIFLQQISKPYKIEALVLGNFDGLHLGHQSLIQKAKNVSKGSVGVLSFSPHPREVLKEGTEFTRIFTEEENVRLMWSYGVQTVFFQKFTKAFSEKTAKEFFSELCQKIKFQKLIVGFDFKFGKERLSSTADLKELCEQHQVELCVVEKVEGETGKVSSTQIKNKLSQGQVVEASKDLGRPLVFTGVVVSDQGMGTQMGFPTLNIKFPKNLALRRGVYFSKATSKKVDQTYFAITNFGLRPSLNKVLDWAVMETHVLDLNFKSASGEWSIELLDFCRDEMKFESVETLKLQIQKDVHGAKEFFGLS